MFREYGSRYWATASVAEPLQLANVMLAAIGEAKEDLRMPLGAEVSIGVEPFARFKLRIGGLTDDYLYPSPTATKYSQAARTLIHHTIQFAESFGWRTAIDITDRRFLVCVELLTEWKYSRGPWVPGAYLM